MSRIHTSIVALAYQGTSIPGLQIVAKRYCCDNAPKSGLTLLFAHCTGSHKEIWEPIIESLLTADNGFSIREAWSVDWQSHGDAATVNDRVLKDQINGLSVREYAIGLRALALSRHLVGHNIVAIGHSIGASAILLSTIPTSSSLKILYTAIVIVEPSLITRDEYANHVKERETALLQMQKAVTGRRDTWNSPAEASRYFSKKLPWRIWNPKSLELFTQHGLREIPAPTGEGGFAVNKVTLSCSRRDELSAYIDNEPQFDAIEILGNMHASFPIHCIFGQRVDLVPPYAHNSTLSVRKMASIQRVPDAGHFVVQENPDGLATCITNVLQRTNINVDSKPQSRL